MHMFTERTQNNFYVKAKIKLKTKASIYLKEKQ